MCDIVGSYSHRRLLLLLPHGLWRMRISVIESKLPGLRGEEPRYDFGSLTQSCCTVLLWSTIKLHMTAGTIHVSLDKNAT